jgi:SecD/SecF fusion protein
MNSLFAQVAAQGPNEPQAASGVPGYIHFLIVIGVLVVSAVLGGYLGKKLRMPDHGWRIGIILFSILASLVVLTMGPNMKWGIDLRGGALLVYEVDQTKLRTDQTVDMDKLIGAVKLRLNPAGQKELTVRTYGKEQIEILIPEVEGDQVSRIEQLISRVGTLQFRILASRQVDDDAQFIKRAEADASKSQMQLTDPFSGKLQAWWVPVKPAEEQAFKRDAEQIVLRIRKVDNRDVMEVLVLEDKWNVNGGYLKQANSETDQQTGKPCVGFKFNTQGAILSGGLTGDNKPQTIGRTTIERRMGIILDDELYTAPVIKSTITDEGKITGDFTQAAVDDIVNVLNAGSLPAALVKEPISKQFIGPTLGSDTIESSKKAIIIASIAVPLFMLIYYHFCGIVAVIALVLNMLMLFAIMLACNVAFTLTGLASLALTIGMAVDNNVLVFERMREEMERGATVRMAIRNAFHRASATIIDCNSTHLIAAAVLYTVGSDQLRGFAVPLLLGTAISIYTSVFVAHVIFDIAEKRQWITKLKMFHIIRHTSIDFMGWFPFCATASIVITVGALFVTYLRGPGILDIDFTGGVSVQVVFREPQKADKVRQMLEEHQKELPDLAISEVQATSNTQAGLQYVLNTSQSDIATVKGTLAKVFSDKLVRNALSFTEPTAITPAKKAAPSGEKQSRIALPPNTWLASAARDGVMLALADEPAKSKNTTPADVKKTPAEAAKPVETPTVPAAPAFSPDQPYAGGSEADLTFQVPLNTAAVEQAMALAMETQQIVVKSTPFIVTRLGDQSPSAKWHLKSALPPDRLKAVLATLKEQTSASPMFPGVSNIGSAVAGGMYRKAIYAVVASWICMTIYLWIRFQNVVFGFAAVVALVHDVLVMLGAIAISMYIANYTGFLLIEPFKINLTIIAAFLTIIGYSVNDTIVVFDRIRENRGKDPDMTRKMINDSTNQTLSRTLLTSFTVFLVVAILYAIGGSAVHGFAFALLIGVITGTYSSIYVAAPILLWLVGAHKKLTA